MKINGVEKSRKGVLYIVATPIGNLEDITLRALRILRSVSLIACEDTRETSKILTKYKIRKKLLSYYRPKESQKIPYILNILKNGEDVALVTDSGTPGISDPGYLLIKRVINEEIQVIPVPGASSIMAGLMASGLNTSSFKFVGFPPKGEKRIKKFLERLKYERSPLIFFDNPKRVKNFINMLKDSLGERDIVVAREVTKINEEFIRGRVSEVLKNEKLENLKGEVSIIVEGYKKKGHQEEFKEIVKRNLKRVIKEYGIPKKIIKEILRT
ncbi:MAG: 16S rRNA (cytidine(1402)-2'-O)-methyltransferase [Acidobacteriota bacterium]